MHSLPIALVVLAACASAAPAPQPAAPTPPPAPVASALTVSTALEPLALACRSAELPQPNALDDDCDGNLDGLGRSALTVAWASAGGAELEVALLDGAGKPITPERERHAAACHDDGAARSSSRSFGTLPDAATLVIRQLRPCKDKGKVHVVVGIATERGSTSYALVLEPDAPLTLAEWGPGPDTGAMR